MTDLFDRLKAPFPPERISWRIGSTTANKERGLALAYIDARDVMERLDEVCGPGGWQCRYPHAGAKTVCEIGIRSGDEWIWKADGAGDTDVEAEKGALSDAFKRSAVRWGIGRYLYDVGSPWVAIEPAGKSFKIKEGELARLTKSITEKQPPAPPQPEIAILSEPAAGEAQATLIADINGCVNMGELDIFIKSDGFKHRVGSLPEVHRTRVRSAYRARAKAVETQGKAA